MLAQDHSNPEDPVNFPKKKEIADFLARFFKDDPSKISLWWITPNLNFGGVTPAHLYAYRPDKVILFIQYAKEDLDAYEKSISQQNTTGNTPSS